MGFVVLFGLRAEGWSGKCPNKTQHLLLAVLGLGFRVDFERSPWLRSSKVFSAQYWLATPASNKRNVAQHKDPVTVTII